MQRQTTVTAHLKITLYFTTELKGRIWQIRHFKPEGQLILETHRHVLRSRAPYNMEKPMARNHTLTEQVISVGSKYCTIICK